MERTKTMNNMTRLLGFLSVALLVVSAFAGDLEEGKELFIRQRYDEAIERFEAALENADGDEVPYIHFYIGRSYEMKNWWKKALTSFEKITREYADHPVLGETMLEMGQCLVRVQQRDEALKMFEECTNIFDDPWIKASGLYNKGALLCGSVGQDKEVERLGKAVDSLTSVISDYEFEDMTTKSWYWLGVCYNRLKEYEKAVEAWQHVLNEGPETIWADIAPALIALAQRRIGEIQKAEEMMAFWVKRNDRAQMANQLQQVFLTGSDDGAFVVDEVKREEINEEVPFQYKIYRVNNGKQIYFYYVRTQKLEFKANGRIISLLEARITDNVKSDDASVILDAKNIDINTENEQATAKGISVFTLREEDDGGKTTRGQNITNVENLTIDLRAPRNFYVIGR
jgi:TolA-binding protein